MSPTFDRDPRKSTPRFIAFAIPFGWILKPENFNQGLDLAISSVKRISPESVDPRVKNYHWLDLVIGMYEAYDKGHYTTVLVDNNNNVLEGPGFNIFSVDDNGLNTPVSGVLEGITRQTAIDLAKELKIPTKEISITSEKFKNSIEAFATSTAGGIIPITKIDGKVIGNGTIGTITSKIKDLYWEKHTDPDWSECVEDLS
jgi:branched-chain amino acid aminotransferase